MADTNEPTSQPPCARCFAHAAAAGRLKMQLHRARNLAQRLLPFIEAASVGSMSSEEIDDFIDGTHDLVDALRGESR